MTCCTSEGKAAKFPVGEQIEAGPTVIGHADVLCTSWLQEFGGSQRIRLGSARHFQSLVELVQLARRGNAPQCFPAVDVDRRVRRAYLEALQIIHRADRPSGASNLVDETKHPRGTA